MKQPLYIIKIGGNVINDESLLQSFVSLVAHIEFPVLLVHGGGKLLNDLSASLQIEQKMIDGRRVTDSETLQLATMVYAGKINKQLVALLQANGRNAIGLSGADANCIKAVKRTVAEHDFGFVGDIVLEGVNSSFISQLLQNNILPVFCSITHDGKGGLLNTNADTIAATLAQAMSSYYEVELCYCFEKKGVLKNIEDGEEIFDSINYYDYQMLVKNEVISNGMLPKLNNAFRCIQNGVDKVMIMHANDISKYIKEKKNVGTALIA